MKQISIKITTQLVVGFSIIFCFILLLGCVAYIQTNKIYLQAETLYQHPLQVRQAIGDLNADVLTVLVARRDAILGLTNKSQQALMDIVTLRTDDADNAFTIIREQYLGPAADVDKAYEAFLLWRVAGEASDHHILAGEMDEAIKHLSNDSELSISKDKLLAGILVIDKFAADKAKDLNEESQTLKSLLTKQLIMIIFSVTVFLIMISYLIIHNIRRPLKELNDVIVQFHQGDMKARSTYSSGNEFGELSISINALMSVVQENTGLSEKASSLAEVMQSNEDMRQFFQGTLSALMAYTGGQMASVYLLSEDKTQFEYFESIGMNTLTKASFESTSFEGEFGNALLTQKIQFLQNIPEETRFVFHSTAGAIMPREIITIPVLLGDQVIAMISLISISAFLPDAMALISRIAVTLNARIAGILAYETIISFKERLEIKNQQLTAQKTELSAQTTELVQQNIELEMQKKQLDEANRLKTNFLSNMSHELRTPLNSIIALSGVLGRKLKNQMPDVEYSYLEIIERNGKNLLLLINDILDISRIEAGREEVEITKFNMRVVINEAMSLFYPIAEQKQIELINYAEKLDHIIESDADKCRHILQNLVGNAMKFTEFGRVSLSVEQREEALKIIIKDTGIGIAGEHLTHIFDEFRQADGGTSRRFGGSGLGLAIAKKYANLLGGTISVKSQLNVGSEFTLTLPIKYQEDNQVSEGDEMEGVQTYSVRSSEGQIIQTTGKTLLLVDDNESAVIQIKDLVDEMGYKVLIARNGNEALEIIETCIPDGIVLDLMMPDIDGFKLLEMIRHAEATVHIPVLVLTAKHLTKEDLKFLKRNNIHQLIQKGDVVRDKLKRAIVTMLFPDDTVKRDSLLPVTSARFEGKLTVLVVEDNPDNMITVRAMLGEHYEIIEASNGDEGITLAERYMPHLVLMDIALPGISGIEAFQAIRKAAKTEAIPIIALTASAMEDERETILSYGFDAYISKPIIAKEFYQVIREVLYGR